MVPQELGVALARRSRSALIVIAAALVGCGPTAATASPTPTESPTAAPTASPLPTASPTSSPTQSPATPGRYTSAELGYSIDLAPGWRRAVCSPGITSSEALAASELFVKMREEEEQLGMGLQAVSVRVVDARGQTPLAWLQASNVVGQGPLRYESATVDGRPGARAVYEATGDTIALVVAARGWIYAIEKGGPMIDPPTDAEMSRILPTLHILDDASLGRGAPTPAPRTAETVAAGLADGFARKDIQTLAQYVAPCITVGAIPGDAVSRSRAAYMSDLARELQSVVTVQVSQTIETDPYLGRFVRSTWSRQGQPDQRVDFVLRPDGQRWSWSASFNRAF